MASLGGRINRALVLITLINAYINYVFQYCYKYLIVKHRRIAEAILFLLLVHFTLSVTFGFFSLIACKSHHQISSAFKFDHRLRRLFRKIRRCCEIENINDWELTSKQIRRLEGFVQQRQLHVLTRNSHGQISICVRCEIVRPDRCHHCRTCDRCILKRDHHCAWFNTCIGFSNQKYYILFLVYLQTYLMSMLLTFAWSILKISDFIVEKTPTQTTTHTNYALAWLHYFHFRLTVFSTIGLVVFIQLLILNNIYLAFNNLTHFELVYPPRLDWSRFAYFTISRQSLFDLGSGFENLKQIFGSQIRLAFLPVWTTLGDGHHFPINTQMNAEENIA